MGQIKTRANGQGNPPNGVVPHELDRGRADDASRIKEGSSVPMHGRIFARSGVCGHKSALLDLIGEAVTAAAHGFNVLVVTRWLKRFAQASDVNVNGSFFHKDMIAPDLIKQL